MTTTLLPLVGVAGLLASGLHMLLRPAAYVGQGSIPATDPRTVRSFGIFFLVIGVPTLILITIRLVQG